MTEPTGTFALALREVTALLTALGEDVRDERRALALLESLGLAIPAAPASLLALGSAIGKVQSAAGEYQTTVETAGESSTEASAKLLALSAAAADAFEELLALGPKLETDFAAYPGLLAEVDLGLLARRLAEWALVTYIRARTPLVYNALALLGVVDPQVQVDEGKYARPHIRTALRWSRLRLAGQDPAALLAEMYGWGSTLFDDRDLLRRLHYLLMSGGLTVDIYPTDTDSAVAEDSVLAGDLRLPLFAQTGEGGATELGLALGRLEATTAGTGAGLVLRPYVVGALVAQFEPRPGLRIAVQGAAEGAGGLGIAVRPPLAVSLVGDTNVGARLAITVDWGREDGEAMVLVRQPDWFSIQFAGVRAELEAVLGDQVEATLTARLLAVGGNLTISPDEGDGFLRLILPEEGITAPFDLGLAWSQDLGVRFVGSGGFEVALPVHLSLAGIIEVHSIHVAVDANASGATLAASATFAVNLGPVHATVDRMGFAAELTAAPDGGNLGPVQAATRFKPPTGAALSVDAGVVTGGGFLFFDPVNEQYAGGLRLEFEKLTLNAIGLLTTRMPDGSPGFSLLVIIQASGFTPIQLGYGFTLNGVGGLLGINRTVAVDVLRAGVRNRTLDAILFSPEDPTPRAPQIVSTLQTVFPPARNQYVFGPMALLGWGAPVTLVTIEVALILELPAPIRLILLGRVRAALPEPDHPVVSINLDVVGVIDFDRRELSVDASLYDSMIGPFALTGDMAARANWGANPDFAMALGGFHPAFTPPSGFPELRRLALALSTGDNPRLRMEAYLALTPNTVQMGARLELYVEAAGFSLEGVLGFDTLIQFSPFRLLADIYAHLALRRGDQTLLGLDIHVHLTGPAPWVVWGEARFKIFIISFSIPFRAEFGRAEDVPAIERQDVWPVLRDSLTADGNWSAQLPADSGRLVVLRDGAGAGELLAHPLGMLTVAENVVPLERTLGLFGSVPPKDYDRFAITGAAGLTIVGVETQYFAPAQFRRMSDAEKLASPPYERMVSGVRLAPEDAVAVGHVQEIPLDYEQSIILDVDQPATERLAAPYTPGGDLVAALAEHGPAGTAELREQGRAKFAPPAPGPTVADPAFVVVTKDNLTLVGIEGLDGSYTAAAERLRQRVDRDELQIVRAEELELA